MFRPCLYMFTGINMFKPVELVTPVEDYLVKMKLQIALSKVVILFRTVVAKVHSDA